MCRSLWVNLIWSWLNVLDVYVHIFHQILEVPSMTLWNQEAESLAMRVKEPQLLLLPGLLGWGARRLVGRVFDWPRLSPLSPMSRRGEWQQWWLLAKSSGTNTQQSWRMPFLLVWDRGLPSLGVVAPEWVGWRSSASLPTAPCHRSFSSWVGPVDVLAYRSWAGTLQKNNSQ